MPILLKFVDRSRFSLTAENANASPHWLVEVSNDLELVLRLKQKIDDSRTDVPATRETFGGSWWGYLTSGASAVRDYAQRSLINVPRRFGSSAALYFFRPWMTTVGTRTVGDALVYVARRGTFTSPGEIIKRVLDGQEGLRAAAASRTTNDPLIVIGHSLGGVILYDIFSHFAPDLQCDLLVTVGSQVGFFQELALLANASAGGFTPGSRVSRPGNIVRWLNVFDTVDVLAFTTQPVFAGVEDFAFSSETGAISAHTAYFWTPHFHRRLGRRIREALV